MSNTETIEQEAGALSHLSVELDTLPKLKENQVWCCARGCGEVTPRIIDFEYSRTEDVKTGRLIESLTEKRMVSPCCGVEMFAWDNELDDEVLVDGKPLVT